MQAAGTRSMVLSTTDRQPSGAVRLHTSKGGNRFDLYVLLRQHGSHAGRMHQPGCCVSQAARCGASPSSSQMR